ncbi:MAG TPA: hypothetical protein VJV79_38100 [Polyangiaceae bacterium]|nr:hypothetical protein [Polyangiaceae bacterium]
MTWTQVLPYIGSGALGGIVTFGLNWAREQRRVVDAYRAPQRHAIGEIIAAGHELQLRGFNWRRALAELLEAARQHNPETLQAMNAEIREVERAHAVAMLNLRGALEVGSLTVVDAQCWQAMVAAAAEFEQFYALLSDETVASSVDRIEHLNAQLEAQAAQLRVAMTALVRTANDRITPAETRRNRRHRRAAQRQLADQLRTRDTQPPAKPNA